MNSHLTSPIFAVIVGDKNEKTFLLHADLLADASDRLAKSVSGDWAEARNKEIELPEEDPALFGYFAEYLYSDAWISRASIDMDSEYIVLARLYALGQRFQADRFQRATRRKFDSNFPASQQYPHQTIPVHHLCDLMYIVLNEIVDTDDVDVLAESIYEHARAQGSKLRRNAYFHWLAKEWPDLPFVLDMGDLKASKTEGLAPRFLVESPYEV